MTWKPALRSVLILLVLVPVAVIVTFLLFPLWSYIESTFGIEAVGHAMIAEWCFIATYILCVLIVMILKLIKKRPRISSGPVLPHQE